MSNIIQNLHRSAVVTLGALTVGLSMPKAVASDNSLVAALPGNLSRLVEKYQDGRIRELSKSVRLYSELIVKDIVPALEKEIKGLVRAGKMNEAATANKNKELYLGAVEKYKSPKNTDWVEVSTQFLPEGVVEKLDKIKEGYNKEETRLNTIFDGLLAAEKEKAQTSGNLESVNVVASLTRFRKDFLRELAVEEAVEKAVVKTESLVDDRKGLAVIAGGTFAILPFKNIIHTFYQDGSGKRLFMKQDGTKVESTFTWKEVPGDTPGAIVLDVVSKEGGKHNGNRKFIFDESGASGKFFYTENPEQVANVGLITSSVASLSK